MRPALLLISILLILFCSLVSATEATYRVAGVVGQEGHWIFAVIEDSHGRCRIYSKGDVLGTGRVIDILQQGVLVETAGNIHLLKLQGSSFISSAGKVEPAQTVDSLRIGSTRPVMGKLTQQEMEYAVKNVATELARDKNKNLDPTILNSIFGLPLESRIIAVNEKAVNGSKEAVNMINTAISNNLPLDFTVADREEKMKIYFKPNQPNITHPHE
jgi:hypothetical protein